MVFLQLVSHCPPFTPPWNNYLDLPVVVGLQLQPWLHVSPPCSTGTANVLHEVNMTNMRSRGFLAQASWDYKGPQSASDSFICSSFLSFTYWGRLLDAKVATLDRANGSCLCEASIHRLLIGSHQPGSDMGSLVPSHLLRRARHSLENYRMCLLGRGQQATIELKQSQLPARVETASEPARRF